MTGVAKEKMSTSRNADFVSPRSCRLKAPTLNAVGNLCASTASRTSIVTPLLALDTAAPMTSPSVAACIVKPIITIKELFGWWT